MTSWTESTDQTIAKLRAATLRRIVRRDGVHLSRGDAAIFVEAFPTLKGARAAVFAARGRDLMPQLRRLFSLARARISLR